MLTNPEMMRTMMEMRGGAGLGGMGGGAQQAQPGLFGLAQQQAQQQRTQAATGALVAGTEPQTPAGMPNMAGLEALFGGGAAGAGGNTPGANPFAGMQDLFGPNSPFGSMNAGAGGMPNLGGFGSFPPPQPQDGRSPEERYETQLQQLRDMGFHNASQNVRALIATGGNVEGAVEYILSGGGL